MENEERRFLVTVVGPTVKIGFTSVLKLLIWSGAAAFAANTLAQTVLKLKATGPQPTVISPSKKEIPLYTASYALLVSASKYLGTGAQGWRPLEETGKDMDRVADVLRGHGFNVWRVSDPTAEELPRIFRKFIAEVGHSKGNRLVFFFSGHGFPIQPRIL